MDRIVIIGNGIAGISAARHVRKHSEHEIIVVSGESDYFFSRTALMYIYMGHMKLEHTKPYEDWFWEKNRIELIKDWVTTIDTAKKTVSLSGSGKLKYDKLILALGSQTQMYDWPGQNLSGVSGLYSLQDLNDIEESTRGIKNATIVGGGLIGVELAEMLHSRGIHVTFLVREKNFWDIVLPLEEAQLVNDEILDNGIDLRLSTELKEIIGDNRGQACGILTSAQEELETQFVGITTGVSPNIGLAEKSRIAVKKGILVDEFLQTSIPDIYAIGDCAELRTPLEHRRAIEPVWYVGRMMGETVARTLCGEKTAYQPGVWFNSAKFFNIEYQTYGTVNPQPKQDEEHFVWESQKDRKLMRIAFSESSGAVLGVNVLGIRVRHELWDKWISEGWRIDEVIKRLEEANFDPEFFKKYEGQIRRKFEEEFAHFEITR